MRLLGWNVFLKNNISTRYFMWTVDLFQEYIHKSTNEIHQVWYHLITAAFCVGCDATCTVKHSKQCHSVKTLFEECLYPPCRFKGRTYYPVSLTHISKYILKENEMNAFVHKTIWPRMITTVLYTLVQHMIQYYFSSWIEFLTSYNNYYLNLFCLIFVEPLQQTIWI